MGSWRVSTISLQIVMSLRFSHWERRRSNAKACSGSMSEPLHQDALRLTDPRTTFHSDPTFPDLSLRGH